MQCYTKQRTQIYFPSFKNFSVIMDQIIRDLLELKEQCTRGIIFLVFCPPAKAGSLIFILGVVMLYTSGVKFDSLL